MHRKYFFGLICAAFACLFIIIISMQREQEVQVNRESIVPHPIAPFKSYISGVGIVESSSENIFISTPVNRIIDKILVKVGMKVKKGDILFQLENRDLRANLLIQQLAYKNAQARLQKLESMPRKEDISAAEASLNSAQAEVDLTKKQYERVQSLPDPRSISQEEKNKRLLNYQQAEAKKQQAEADIEKLKKGTWKPDLEIARIDVYEAQATVESIKTEIERTIIRSPIDGSVLQIKIHEGESPFDPSRVPLMIIGDTDNLHLRVSINQFDVPFFQSDSPAVAFLQGDARIEFPLEFVRIEPYLVSKQNLTNEIYEKVDTRVLQIIYRIKNGDHSVFVGQQMDVFIETKDAP